MLSSKLGEHLTNDLLIITTHIMGLLLASRKAGIWKLRLATGLAFELVFGTTAGARRRALVGKRGKEGGLTPLERGNHSEGTV